MIVPWVLLVGSLGPVDAGRSYVQLLYLNDCNPLLLREPCKSNDTWLTLGMGLEAGLRDVDGNRFVKVALTSMLYTEHQGEAFSESGREIQPQIFSEITTLSVSLESLSRRDNIYPRVEVGLGIVNQDRPLPGLVLYLQGGSRWTGRLPRFDRSTGAGEYFSRTH